MQHLKTFLHFHPSSVKQFGAEAETFHVKDLYIHDCKFNSSFLSPINPFPFFFVNRTRDSPLK